MSEEKQYLYILTDPSNFANNTYKVGIHTGTLKKLTSRYQTYLPKFKLILFWRFPNSRELEKKILSTFSGQRIKNPNDNQSEWIQAELAEILATIIVDQLKSDDEFDEEERMKVILSNFEQQRSQLETIQSTLITGFQQIQNNISKTTHITENSKKLDKTDKSSNTKSDNSKSSETEWKILQHQFLTEPSLNPRTGCMIIENGPTYKRLVAEFGEPFTQADEMHEMHEMQTAFFNNPDINPKTGRRIDIGGPTYKELVLEFGEPPSNK